MPRQLCLHPCRSTTARSTRLFLLQAFDNTQLIAHRYRGREKINTHNPETHMLLGVFAQPDEPIYGRLSPYILCLTAFPCRIRNSKRHAAMPDTKRGHKGASKTA